MSIFYKRPSPSKELQVFNYVRPRLNLSSSSLRTYDTLQKGYVGEKKFYNILKQLLSSKCIVLFDLLLEINGTTFQIDCLLIFQETIYLIEIKNYDGDYYLQEGKWYSVATKKEIRSPLHQLERSELLMQQLIQRNGYHFSIKSYIVFVNESFTLYEASLQMPIIFPTQLNRFIEKLNRIPSILTTPHKKLAKFLVENVVDESKYLRLPEYDYIALKKGITCNQCRGYMDQEGYKNMLCQNCGEIDGVDSAVLRSVVEFAILFPKRKITTTEIFKWCDTIVSRRKIQEILANYLVLVQKGKQSHYVWKN